VRSVFAFPLIMGAVCLGALDIDQDRASTLSPVAVLEATAFAALAVRLLESGQARAATGELDPDIDELLAPRQPVYLAQGMVMADLRVTAEEAVALLRGSCLQPRAPRRRRGPGRRRRQAPPDALTPSSEPCAAAPDPTRARVRSWAPCW
jgi:hypothetical protein